MSSQDAGIAVPAAQVAPPSESTWQLVLEVIGEYKLARSALIDGEGMVGDFIQPSANEVRNGWDDIAKVIARWVSESDHPALLAEAKRHFRRARSEVYETVLLTRLDALRTILDSLEKDPEYRIAKATHYAALREAFERARVEGGRAREIKGVDPDQAITKAKAGISIAQNALDGFMKKAGAFEIASEVRGIEKSQQDLKAGQRGLLQGQVTGARLAIAGLVLAIALFASGILFNKYFLAPDRTVPAQTDSTVIQKDQPAGVGSETRRDNQ